MHTCHKNKNHRRTRAVAALLLAVLLLTLSALTAYRVLLQHAADAYRTQYVTFTPAESEVPDLDESTAILTGNGGSFYYLWGWLLSEDADSTRTLQKKLRRELTEYRDESLVLIEINLMNYSERELSDAALSQTDTILSAWQNAGYGIILRFLYDWDGSAPDTEPKELSTVKMHMSQLAPVINAHADGIYTMQGIFVGDCGEMHHSRFMDDVSMCELMHHLASVTDPDIFLSVRTPAQRRTILGSAETFPEGNDLAERLGLFNDGMLGSDNDLGTYGEADRADAALSEHWVREQELLYQDELCRRVPNGGEAVIDNPLNDLPAAVEALRTMHVSYLNRMHHAEVIEKWRSSVMQTDDVWNGTDGYTYIDAHLGSRYRCSAFSQSAFDWQTDNAVSLCATLTNTGFSGSYEPLTVTLTITDSAGRPVWSESRTDTGIELLTNGEASELVFSVNPADFSEGTYYAAIACTRADGTKVPFAAQTLYGAYGYRCAAFTVNRTPASMPADGALLDWFLHGTASAK